MLVLEATIQCRYSELLGWLNQSESAHYYDDCLFWVRKMYQCSYFTPVSVNTPSRVTSL